MVRFLQCIGTISWTIKRKMVTYCSPLKRDRIKLKDKVEMLRRRIFFLLEISKSSGFLI